MYEIAINFLQIEFHVTIKPPCKPGGPRYSDRDKKNIM